MEGEHNNETTLPVLEDLEQKVESFEFYDDHANQEQEHAQETDFEVFCCKKTRKGRP